MKYLVRDTGPASVNEEHGVFDDLGEAKKCGREVAIARGFDPATLKWTRYTLSTWGLGYRTPTGPCYCYVGIEAEG